MKATVIKQLAAKHDALYLGTLWYPLLVASGIVSSIYIAAFGVLKLIGH